MPSLYKRGSVYYIAVIEDGKRIYKSTGKRTKQEAFSYLLAFKRSRTPRKRIGLAAFVDQFLQYARDNYTPANLANTERVLRLFLTAVGEKPLVAIMPLDIERWKSERLQAVRGIGGEHVQRISPVSVNGNLRTLKASFGYALKWGLIEKNPMEGVTFLRLPERSRSYLTAAELQSLLVFIKDRNFRDIVLFAVLTGMRRGEMLHLKWEHVDLEKRLLLVESSAGFRTKNGKRRAIPLNDTAVFLLRSRQPGNPSAYVFAPGLTPLSSSWVSHRFKQYLRSAGLPEDLHFHSLRHTFASWLAQDGVSLYAIQKLLGHSSGAVTQIYSHLQPEELHGVVARIEVPLN